MKRIPPMVSLRALRHAYGLTGDQLAERIHEQGVKVDTDHLYNVETGRRKGSVKLMCAWARALRITRLDIYQSDDLRALLNGDEDSKRRPA